MVLVKNSIWQAFKCRTIHCRGVFFTGAASMPLGLYFPIKALSHLALHAVFTSVNSGCCKGQKKMVLKNTLYFLCILPHSSDIRHTTSYHQQTGVASAKVISSQIKTIVFFITYNDSYIKKCQNNKTTYCLIYNYIAGKFKSLKTSKATFVL